MKFVGLVSVTSLAGHAQEVLSVLQVDAMQTLRAVPKKLASHAHQGEQVKGEQVKTRLSSVSDTAASLEQLAQSSIADPLKIPSDDILDPVLQQFTAMKSGLLDENKVNQDLVNNANDVVMQCNAARNEHFDKSGGLNDKANAVAQGRSGHQSCRQQEVTATDAETAAHQAFQDALSCEPSSEWFAAVSGSCTPSLEVVVNKAKDSENKKAALLSKQESCDQMQTQFESDFCGYAHSLEDACSDYEACYTQAVKSKDSIDADVKKLETSHKQLYLGVEKCECYIGIIKAARDKNLTQDDLLTCSEKTLSATDLDVTYPAVESKASCNTDNVKSKPGEVAWKAKEYSQFVQDALEPVTACLVTTTTTTIPASPELCGDDSFNAKVVGYQNYNHRGTWWTGSRTRESQRNTDPRNDDGTCWLEGVRGQHYMFEGEIGSSGSPFTGITCNFGKSSVANRFFVWFVKADVEVVDIWSDNPTPMEYWPGSTNQPFVDFQAGFAKTPDNGWQGCQWWTGRRQGEERVGAGWNGWHWRKDRCPLNGLYGPGQMDFGIVDGEVTYVISNPENAQQTQTHSIGPVDANQKYNIVLWGDYGFEVSCSLKK